MSSLQKKNMKIMHKSIKITGHQKIKSISTSRKFILQSVLNSGSAKY